MSEQQYYLGIDGQRAGPFSLEQVRQLYAAGTVTGETLYFIAGGIEWLPLAGIVALLQSERVVSSAAPPVITRAPMIPVAAILAKPGEMLCLDCGIIKVPQTTSGGSFLVGLALWIFFCIPGLIYTIWCLTARKKQYCMACGSSRVIPPGSPQARAILGGQK